jgi:hypothetical protein
MFSALLKLKTFKIQIKMKKEQNPKEPQKRTLNIPVVSGCLSEITFSYKHPTGKKTGKLEYDDDVLILRYKGGCIMYPELDKLVVLK